MAHKSFGVSGRSAGYSPLLFVEPTTWPVRMPPPKVSSAVLRVLFLDSPRAEVGDLEAFETFLQKAFSRRRRTLENNLQDSYANLKDYLRFLNLQGSARAEALSVVELARLWTALASGGIEERGSGARPG